MTPESTTQARPTYPPRRLALIAGKFEGAMPRDLLTDDLQWAYRHGDFCDRAILGAELSRRRWIARCNRRGRAAR